jgi:polysaccharide biosynthesis transport protein
VLPHEDMNLREALDVLWRRKLVVVCVALAVVGIAFGALRLVTPVYESRSTLVLSPTTQDDFSFFLALDSIVPIYANAATTSTTYALAADELGRNELGRVSVETFKGSPIIRIEARHQDPQVARDTSQAVSDALLSQVERGQVGIPSLELRQVDQPEASSDPVFPRTNLTLAVAVILGLGFGIGAAFLRETLTSKVETSEDLAQLAGVPVLGEIRSERGLRKLRSPEQLTSNARFHRMFESLRDLRTNLQFSEDEHRSVVVTSPEGQHGKTMLAFGLAVTIARGNTRTLLLDADLRRGRIAEMLKLPRTPGLMEALNGMPVDEAIRKTSLPSLHVMTGGQLVADPGEVLLTNFAEVLHQLEEMYDVVVIDSTPLVPVNDARIIATYAESTLVVASAGSTTRRQIRAAIERLSLVSVRPAAVILNNSKAPHTEYFYRSA